MSAQNLVEVTSPEHFQALLNADLSRPAVLNFWAPWAAPCTQMNEVVKELAAKYPTVLFLQIEAESLPDISETFEVEAVPSFVLLRGHTLLERISGANASALAQSVATHSRSPAATTVQSRTNAAPAAPPASIPQQAQESEAELNERCRQIMNQSKVMVFMKGEPDAPRCGFSRQTVKLLRDEGVQFSHFDILEDEAVRQGLKKLNDWPTYPQIIVNGELVGGLDILKEMVSSGELKEILSG